MGIFDKRKSISRRELKSSFEKHHGRIPETGGKKYYHGQRSSIIKEVFGSKYGSQIDKHDYKRAVRDLETARRGAKTRGEKSRIDEKIRYLRSEELGGKNI